WRRGTSEGHTLPDTREKVIFRQLGVDERPSKMIVLGRPRGTLDVTRAGEPRAIRVNLGGVGAQRVVADTEVVGRVHPGGDLQRPVAPLKALAGALLPLLEDLRVRRVQAAPNQFRVQGDVLLQVKRGEVVHLHWLPRLAVGLRVPVGVSRRLEPSTATWWVLMWSGCG